MSKKVLSAIALSVIAATGLAQADGCYIATEKGWRERRERSYINEPEQKALILFQQSMEDLVISPSYQGDADDFAWVVPVPARPKVQIVEGALFHELAAMQPKLPSRERTDSSYGSAVAKGVAVIERKTVGAYDVSVLEATNGTALMEWLKVNHYHLPSSAVGPISFYVRAGWTFVACRVKIPVKAAAGLKEGTLAPLRLTFRTNRPVYPMRLSSVNREAFQLLIYVALPRGGLANRQQTLYCHEQPSPWNREGARLIADIRNVRLTCPTLAKLSDAPLCVYSQKFKVEPSQCTSDYYWRLNER